MEPLALLGLAGLVFVKEAGVPVPVPGDLLVVAAGIASAGQAGLPAPVVLAGILAAGYVGGSLQFILVRGTLRRFVLAVLARLGVGRDRLERLSGWLARRGARGVAIARATPAVRVGAIAASGLAAIPYGAFLGGIVIGNGIFVSAHFVLGYLVGPPAERLMAGLGGIALGVAVLVVFAGLGAFGWRGLRRRRATAGAGAAGGNGYAGWLEGACPACLALTVVRPDVLGG
jgi:membrane protein DedA with SNARE-associated domain